ncbi:MAG: AhpC/TSA family protein [Promethearchaeota archaeon]|nr:MAG: AhpC/TSA family protein [Candidatus Lokiarchaeota archaeon]
MKELSNQYGYKFTVISDRGATIAKQFNVYTFGRPIDIVYLKTKLAIPSTFLIDKKLRIVWKYIGTREDRPSIPLLLEKVETYIRKSL